MSALAILATYYKFRIMTGPDSPFPWLDMAGTLALVVGGVAGMEMWARWAHKVLWHDFQPGWALHKSHHVPRVGPFEVRDSRSLLASRTLRNSSSRAAVSVPARPLRASASVPQLCLPVLPVLHGVFLQANDLFAIMNAVPAIALILYGFLTPTMSGSLCFGAGLGITLFGIAYMFVHDGLVHRWAAAPAAAHTN